MNESQKQQLLQHTVNTIHSSMFGKLFEILVSKNVLTETEIQEIKEHAVKQAEDISGVDLLDLVRSSQTD